MKAIPCATRAQWVTTACKTRPTRTTTHVRSATTAPTARSSTLSSPAQPARTTLTPPPPIRLLVCTVRLASTARELDASCPMGTVRPVGSVLVAHSKLNRSSWVWNTIRSSTQNLKPLLKTSCRISGNFTDIDVCMCPTNNYTGGICQPGTYCPSGSPAPVLCIAGQYCEDYELALPNGEFGCLKL